MDRSEVAQVTEWAAKGPLARSGLVIGDEADPSVERHEIYGADDDRAGQTLGAVSGERDVIAKFENYTAEILEMHLFSGTTGAADGGPEYPSTQWPRQV
jgi:hypothetical protein